VAGFRIAPSLLSADFTHLEEQILLALKGGASLLHIDVMDGHFVPNISVGVPIVEVLSRKGYAPLDVHLMVERPERSLHLFFLKGVEKISVHMEATPHIYRALMMIQEKGIQGGVALNPGTPIEALSPVLERADFFLVMTVNPGFGGQSFLPESVERVRALHRLLTRAGMRKEIEVDGGVNPENAKLLRQAGADIFIAGHSIFQAPDIPRAVRSLKKSLKEAEKSGLQHSLSQRKRKGK